MVNMILKNTQWDENDFLLADAFSYAKSLNMIVIANKIKRQIEEYDEIDEFDELLTRPETMLNSFKLDSEPEYDFTFTPSAPKKCKR